MYLHYTVHQIKRENDCVLVPTLGARSMPDHSQLWRPPASRGPMQSPPPGPAGRSLFGDLPQLRRDWLGTFSECTRRHGPVVRFRTPWPLKPMVLLTEPGHIDQVLKDPQHYRKGAA